MFHAPVQHQTRLGLAAQGLAQGALGGAAATPHAAPSIAMRAPRPRSRNAPLSPRRPGARNKTYCVWGMLSMRSHHETTPSKPTPPTTITPQNNTKKTVVIPKQLRKAVADGSFGMFAAETRDSLATDDAALLWADFAQSQIPIAKMAGTDRMTQATSEKDIKAAARGGNVGAGFVLKVRDYLCDITGAERVAVGLRLVESDVDDTEPVEFSSKHVSKGCVVFCLFFCVWLCACVRLNRQFP
jgi:hypothetical protein